MGEKIFVVLDETHQSNDGNDDEYLIDRGSYYEIMNYKPRYTYDEEGRVLTGIFCPYIPKNYNQIPGEVK